MVKYIIQWEWQKRIKGYGDRQRIEKRREMVSKYRRRK
jgi:hypothetical protein